MHRTSVIRNGQMLGVAEQRSRGAVSSGSMQLLGEAKLQLFYNDGNNVCALLGHDVCLYGNQHAPAHRVSQERLCCRMISKERGIAALPPCFAIFCFHQDYG